MSSKIQPLRSCFYLGQLVDKSAEKYGNSREAVVSVHQGPLRKTFEGGLISECIFTSQKMCEINLQIRLKSCEYIVISHIFGGI